jgi:hypothetical protein
MTRRSGEETRTSGRGRRGRGRGEGERDEEGHRVDGEELESVAVETGRFYGTKRGRRDERSRGSPAAL